MEKYEKLLMEVARQNMKQFNFRSFKRSHPSLLKSIVEAMHLCYLKGHHDGQPNLKEKCNLN